MSNGCTIFVACQGQPEAGGGAFEEEFRAFRVDPASRMRRMEEFVEILRLVSTQEHASYHGTYYQFDDLTVAPLPIWLVSNPDLRKTRNVRAGFGRVARLGDGWMVRARTPDEVKQSSALIRGYAAGQGRELGPEFEVCVYYNINVGDDHAAALEESKRFLDSYYSFDYHPVFLERWVAAGPPQRCIEEIRAFVDAGATTITLRPTGYDQERQFQRVTEEILPAFA